MAKKNRVAIEVRKLQDAAEENHHTKFLISILECRLVVNIPMEQLSQLVVPENDDNFLTPEDLSEDPCARIIRTI